MIRTFTTIAAFLLATACGDAEPSSAPASEAVAAAAAAVEPDTGRTDAGLAPGIMVVATEESDAPHVDSEERAAARHILISYLGARGARPTVSRSRGQARESAESLLERIRAGEDIGTLAFVSSDDGSSSLRGMLGAFGRGVMDPTFEEAVFALKPGEVSGLVESPFGFHIIERLAIREIRLGQVLVQQTGSNHSQVERSPEEARARAEDARRRLLAGEDLTIVARELSDGPMGLYGGALGWVQQGQLMPVFDEPAFALEPGEATEVIETRLGYHVLFRIE